MKPKIVKTIDKVVAWTERIKNPIVYANEKVKDSSDYQLMFQIMVKKMTI